MLNQPTFNAITRSKMVYLLHKFNFTILVLLFVWVPLRELPGQASHTEVSKLNMVASVNPIATDAGLKAFEQGGNAVDAAVATALTLGVVDGFNSGIGGGCFILIRTADGKLIAIDGREMAPGAAHRDMYLRDGVADGTLSRVGALASGVPGALKAYSGAVSGYGKLPFASVVLDAAEIAEQGFVVDRVYSSRLRSTQRYLKQFPGSAAALLKPDGSIYQPGDVLKQPDLANSMRQISKSGTDWFYGGEFAQKTAEWMSQNGGIITVDDFKNYKTVDRNPVRSTYRGYEIVGFPPPSSGGVHVAQILNILETFDLRELYQEDPAQMRHVVAEAMKLAFADRAYWLGDPDYAKVPRGLIDKKYAQELAKKINIDQVSEVTSHGTPPRKDGDFFGKHTTHVSAADAEGNWVAITTTVNTTFGSKVIVPGLGVVMNNEMDDFSIAPGVPNAFGLIGGENNAVAAGKRPLSSMSPTIVLKDGQPIMTIGAAGGPKIITQVVWGIINHLDLGMPIGQSIGEPRIHHQWSPDRLAVERKLDADQVNRLKELGHNVSLSGSGGVTQAIAWDKKTGLFTGAHDPRVPGKAAGQQ